MQTIERPTSVSASPIPATVSASLVLIALAWAMTVVAAAHFGLLGALGRVFMPGYALLVGLGIALPTLAYFALPSVRHAVHRIGLYRLTLWHAWRIPAALLFFYYGLQGKLPALFWMLAGAGDLLAGCYALALLWRAPSHDLYGRVHRFGFADFVLAVGTGLTFTLLGDSRMAVLTTLPMAMIPLFGVGLSGASHIAALHMLRRHQHTAI